MNSSTSGRKLENGLEALRLTKDHELTAKGGLPGLSHRSKRPGPRGETMFKRPRLGTLEKA